MGNRYKLIEEILLKEADLQIERAESQGEKAICELFKSALLKKYKDSYDSDLQRGEVNKETVDYYWLMKFKKNYTASKNKMQQSTQSFIPLSLEDLYGNRELFK